MLLQTEASTYVLGLVPKALVMLFCGLVVHYLVFFFLSFCNKLFVRLGLPTVSGWRFSPQMLMRRTKL
jgi:hypothetical protein